LFSKEQELVERLTPFCNRWDKEIEFLYSLSPSFMWTLHLKLIDNERKE